MALTTEEELLIRETLEELCISQRRLAKAIGIMQVLVGDEPTDYRERYYGRLSGRQDDPGTD